jgi:hypothetical protein
MDALLGSAREEVNVFLDKQRLQPARDFQLDFVGALLASSLPVILMSSAALLKMVSLKTDSPIDNLLLEWALIADLKASGIISHCLTILFGTHNKLAGSCADVLGDIFKENMTAVLAAVKNDLNYDRARSVLASVADLDGKLIFDVLPDIAVKSINDKARCILQAHGLPVSPDIDGRSVRAVINSLKSSMGIEAWEEAKKVNSSHANEEALRVVIQHCSDKVCSILEKDMPLSATAAHAALQVHAVTGGGEGAAIAFQQQQQPHLDSTEAIIQRLVDILARAGIVPIEKHQQFAQALYENGISNQQILRDSVLGDSPDVDLEQDVGMNRVQKRNLLKFIAAS